MKLIISLLFSIIFVSCGKEAPKSSPSYVNPKLEEYIRKFEVLYSRSVRNNLIVELGDTSKVGPSVIGFCQYYSSGKRKIVISTQFYETYSHADIELLVFHELGHCVLNRGHSTNEMIVDYSSIMSPYHIGGFNYISNYTYYLKELLKINHLAYTNVNQGYKWASQDALYSINEEEREEIIYPHESELHEGCVHFINDEEKNG